MSLSQSSDSANDSATEQTESLQAVPSKYFDGNGKATFVVHHAVLEAVGVAIEDISRVGFSAGYLSLIFQVDERLQGIVGKDVWEPRLLWTERGATIFGVEKDTPVDLLDLEVWISSTYQITSPRLRGLIKDVLNRTVQEHDPLKELLSTVVWDGVTRLTGEVCRRLHKPGYLNEQEKIESRYIELWMAQAIRRVFEPGCSGKYALLLHGRQNGGKSSLVEILGIGHSCDGKLDMNGSLEDIRKLRRKWIWEIGEKGNVSKRTADELKDFISAKSDNVREHHAEYVDMPRRQVFAFTSNNPALSKDDTGNVRFLPVAVTSVDFAWFEQNVMQLWAEAYQYFLNGRYYFSSEEEESEHAKYADMTVRCEDPIVDELGTIDWSQKKDWKLNEIMHALNMKLTDKVNQKSISEALRKAGWISKRHRTDGAFWIAPASVKIESEF